MKKIRCEICDSNQIKKDSESAFVCQDCGMQYDIATVRTLLTEDMQKPCEFTEDQKTNLNSQNALNCSPTFNNESIIASSKNSNGILGELSQNYINEIERIAFSGDRSWKIKAIGLYREATGLGLAEEKNAIENYYKSIDITTYKNDFQFTVKHCDFVNGRIRILGEVKSGAISKDDKILINYKISVIRDIFYEGKQLSTATIGMSVLIIINSNEKFKIPKGTIIFSAK